MAFQSFPPNCWSTYPRCTTAHASTINSCSPESSAAARAASGGAEVAASASASVRAAWRRVAPAANGSRLVVCANLGTDRAAASGRAVGKRTSMLLAWFTGRVPARRAQASFPERQAVSVVLGACLCPQRSAPQPTLAHLATGASVCSLPHLPFACSLLS